MCNAWNHRPSCRCGWGGEGHLGGGRSGATAFALGPSPVMLSGRAVSRNGKQTISFLDPNARCPVCRAKVYFYQSPHGGRVFFDDLGWPWPKHPCTDNQAQRLSSDPVQWIGNDDDQLAHFLVHEWVEKGYYPLICTMKKGGKQVGGEFLFTREGESARSVWLFLDSRVHVTKDALFFIKEIDAADEEYELKFCFKRRANSGIATKTIIGRITSFVRPVLKEGKVAFKDFTGFKRRNLTRYSRGDRTFVKKRSPRKGQNEKQSLSNRKPTSCEYCGKRIENGPERRKHMTGCSSAPLKCRFCLKPIPRHQIDRHETSDCRKRSERTK